MAPTITYCDPDLFPRLFHGLSPVPDRVLIPVDLSHSACFPGLMVDFVVHAAQHLEVAVAVAVAADLERRELSAEKGFVPGLPAEPLRAPVVAPARVVK
jgi:hypothetical protein